MLNTYATTRRSPSGTRRSLCAIEPCWLDNDMQMVEMTRQRWNVTSTTLLVKTSQAFSEYATLLHGNFGLCRTAGQTF